MHSNRALLGDESLGSISVGEDEEVGTVYLTSQGQQITLLSFMASLLCWKMRREEKGEREGGEGREGGRRRERGREEKGEGGREEKG